MSDRIDQLERLANLRRSGTLTADEYQSQKAQLLRGTAKGGGAEYWARNRRWLSPLSGVIGLGVAIFVIKPLLHRSSSVASEYENLCLLAPFMKIESLGHRVSELTSGARGRGAKVTWERTTDGAIVRLIHRDALTDEDSAVGIELTRTPNAAPLSDCIKATEGAVATRMEVDGEEQSGLAVGVTMQQILGPERR